MQITQKQFEEYETVRKSGKVNMYDIKAVARLTFLKRDEVKFIMNNYDTLSQGKFHKHNPVFRKK